MTEKTVKNVKNKETYLEESFYLLNSLKDNACIYCINKSCKIAEKHSIDFPYMISKFVQNPTYIPEIKKVIDLAQLDFNGKKIFYSVCNFVHKKCRNCDDGRIKYINFGDKQIILCYPILNDAKNSIKIGLHIDIKLVVKGKKHEAFAIPLEVKFENTIYDEYNEYNEEFQKTNDNIVIDTMLSPTLTDVSYNTPFSDVSYSEPLKNEWPLLSPEKKSNTSPVVKDYSQLKKIIMNDEKSKYNDENHKYNNENHTYNDEKYKKIDKIEDNKDNKENIENLKLIKKNNTLENEIILLKLENKKLKETVENCHNVMKNNKIYDEILYNINEINNKVTEDFLSTNYSEYLIF